MNVQPIKPYNSNNKAFGARPELMAKQVIVNALTEIHKKNPNASWLHPSEELTAAKAALTEISQIGDNIGLTFNASRNSATKDIDIRLSKDFDFRRICSIPEGMPPLERILNIRDGLTNITDTLNQQNPKIKALKDVTGIFR